MHQFRRAALIALLVLIAAWASRALAHGATETAPVWLASGVTFAALVVSARWFWFATLAGAGFAMFVWGLAAHGLGLAGAGAYAGIEIVSMGIGAWIATAGRRDPDTPSGTTLFIVGALVAAVLGATLGVELWRWQRPQLSSFDEWLAWTFPRAVGLLLLAPVATAYRGFRVKRSGGMPMTPFLGGLAAFAAFVATALVVFGDHVAERFGDLAATLAYLPMPFLLVAALLWGPRGGAVATLLGSLLIIWRTAQGGGPFAVTEGFPGEAVIEVQGFVAVWAIVLLLARSLSEGRRHALERAHTWRLRYERTLSAVGMATVEYDAVTGRATWGQGAASVLGIELTNVHSLAEWLDRIDPAERGIVQATWAAVAAGDEPGSEQDYHVKMGDGRLEPVRERLAGVRGGDGRVEQVTAVLRRAVPDAGAAKAFHA